MGSDDPDEITSWVSRRDGDHSRVVHGTGPYGFRLARIETPSVQIAWASTRLANTLRARFRQPTFHVPLGGVQRYVYGRRRFEAAAGRLVFMAPETDVTRHSAGEPLMAIELDPSAFESEVQSRHEERSRRGAASAADGRTRGAAAARVDRGDRRPGACAPSGCFSNGQSARRESRAIRAGRNVDLVPGRQLQAGGDPAPQASRRLDRRARERGDHPGPALRSGADRRTSPATRVPITARHVTNSLRLRAAPCRGPAAIIPGRAG